MATSSVPVTPGTGGKNLATNSVSEDSITKDISRAVLNSSGGVELSDATGLKISSTQVPDASTFVSGATAAMTGTATVQLLPAPAAGLRNYVTTIIVSNAHATIGTDVTILDGATVLLTIPAAALYGGAAITLPTPLRQPTLATALSCANVTTGANTKVSAVGYKAA